MSDPENGPESDLGPMPEPTIESGEPNPGGVDAIDADSGPIAIPDLTPEENPAVDDQVPDSLVEQMSGEEDTSTKATRDDTGTSSDTDDETGDGGDSGVDGTPDQPEEDAPV